MMMDIKQLLKGLFLACVAITLNEILFSFVSTRCVLLCWALLCLWILYDSMLVATQLTNTELLLQHQTKLNNILHEQNLAFSTQMIHNQDNHQLLCELRTRLMLHGQRLKEHHQMATYHLDNLSSGNSPPMQHNPHFHHQHHQIQSPSSVQSHSSLQSKSCHTFTSKNDEPVMIQIRKASTS
jgi:hypothetical protein